MTPSSDSISSTSLRFGADIHIHASTRRSTSVARSMHHGHRTAVYDQGPQTYASLIADARAPNAVSPPTETPIPPSSINNIPRLHKKILRRHSILLWVVIVIFLISLIALTAAIVVGAVKAHQRGQNGVKCAAIIVGVFAFSGLVGSAAVIWLILTGRKERARLEKRWANEERVKEAVSIWERHTESQLRKIIKDRGRSLSRSRSRGRDRNRPSFRDMTSAPASSKQMPENNPQLVSRRERTPWPNPMDVSSDIDDDHDDAIDEEKHEEKLQEMGSSYNNNGDEAQNDSGHGKEVKVQATQERRDSALKSFQDLDPLGSENDDDDKVETASRSNIDVLEQEILSRLSLPLDHSKTSPTLPDSSQTSPMPLKSSSTYFDFSPTDPYPTASGPHDPPRAPSIKQAPFAPDIVPSEHHTIENTPGGDTTPRHVPGWNHARLGSAQSDENFQAMLDLADDVGSDDEKDREIRRQKGKEKVEEWASSVDPEADAGEREERVRNLKEALEKGLKRVANKKRERRAAMVGSRASAHGGGGSERRR